MSTYIPSWATSISNFLSSFNDRELAFLIWIIALAIYFLVRKETRESIIDLVNIELGWKVTLTLALFLLYFSMCISLISIVPSWNASLFKESIIWLLGAFALISRSVVKHEVRSWEEIIKENIAFIVFVEFIVNTYVFDLWFEIILLPVVVLLTLVQVTTTSNTTETAKRMAHYITSSINIVIIAYALIMAIMEPSELSVFSFLLPIILTLLIIPLQYGLAIWSLYDLLDAKLKILNDDAGLHHKVKRDVFRVAGIRLNELRNIVQNLKKMHYLENKTIKNLKLLASGKLPEDQDDWSFGEKPFIEPEVLKERKERRTRQFASVRDMFHEFRDFMEETNTLHVIDDGMNPVVSIHPVVFLGETSELRTKQVKRAILYAVYRTFMNTNRDTITVTGMPLVRKGEKEELCRDEAITFTTTRGKALQNAIELLGATSFDDLQGDGELWSNKFSRGYYADRNPGLEDFFNGLMQR